jgi:hypothetical protein
MHQQLEIHVPIEPTPSALTRLRYLAASLEMYGGHLGGSSLVVTVGADEEPRDLDAELPWARSLPIAWRWIDREVYREHGPAATRLLRFTADFQARHVLMLEADMLVVAPLGGLVGQVVGARSLAGVPVEGAPSDLAAAGSGPLLDPAMLIAPQRQMRALGETIVGQLAATAELDPDWRIAAAVAEAARRCEIPLLELPRRYCFVNDREWMTRYYADALDLRIVRYCRAGQLDPEADFRSPATVDEMLLRTGWNEADTALTLRLSRIHTYVKALREEQERMGVTPSAAGIE